MSFPAVLPTERDAVVERDGSAPLRHAVGAAGHKVSLLGVSIAYDDPGGPLPPVVCLHAIGHGAGDFVAFRQRVGESFRVIAIDWPGQGASDPDPQPLSVDRYRALLVAFLDHLGLDKVTLLGNSVGGATALAFAARYPERVHRLVVCNPGGLFHRFWVSRLMISLMVALFAAGASRRRGFLPLFSTFYRMILALPPAHTQRDRIIATGHEIAPVLRDAWRSFADDSADLRRVVPKITAPTLVTWSTADHFNQLWANRSGIQKIPGVTLRLFPGGHSPFLECPDDFADAFFGFASDAESSSP